MARAPQRASAYRAPRLPDQRAAVANDPLLQEWRRKADAGMYVQQIHSDTGARPSEYDRRASSVRRAESARFDQENAWYQAVMRNQIRNAQQITQAPGPALRTGGGSSGGSGHSFFAPFAGGQRSLFSGTG